MSRLLWSISASDVPSIEPEKKAARERKFHISDISPEDAMVVVKPSSPQYFFPHLVSPPSKNSAIISVEFPFDALGR